MTLAIFDLDETLIEADSDHLWGQYVVDHGLAAADHEEKNNHFYNQYKAGELDIDAYLEFACSILARQDMETLLSHRRRFIEEVIKPIVLPEGEALVNRHREKADTLMIITSTIEFVTRPIADLFGVATLLAPIPQIRDERYTGKIDGVPSFGEGKVTRLMEWLDVNREESLQGSCFYSDSHNDLPLLRRVDNPVAVDPDPILKSEAEARGWQIISLRK